jgi:hypothetical protein
MKHGDCARLVTSPDTKKRNVVSVIDSFTVEEYSLIYDEINYNRTTKLFH